MMSHCEVATTTRAGFVSSARPTEFAEAELSHHVLTFDPSREEPFRFVPRPSVPLVPSPIPWPTGLAPTAVTEPPPPAPDAPLPSADVLVVTWTAAEALALAEVLTPGRPATSWNPYRHRWDDYLPHIAEGAPARDAQALARYAASRIGNATVLVVKSELHLCQDGPDLPVRALWKQMITETGAALVITTGTAAAVGRDVELGDVVISASVRFDCTKTFAEAGFAKSGYRAPNPAARRSTHLELAEQRLLPVNARQLPRGNRHPHIHVDTPTTPAEVLTTDFFAFDDAEDSYQLRSDSPAARAVEIGDAVLGLVTSCDLTAPPEWVVVRNAAVPQLPAQGTLRERGERAAALHERYAYWTTIGSAIACWALIAAEGHDIAPR